MLNDYAQLDRRVLEGSQTARPTLYPVILFLGRPSTQPHSPRTAWPLELYRTPRSECELIPGHRLRLPEWHAKMHPIGPRMDRRLDTDPRGYRGSRRCPRRPECPRWSPTSPQTSQESGFGLLAVRLHTSRLPWSVALRGACLGSA